MDFIRDAFAQTIEILHDLPYQGTRTYKGDQASVLVTFFLESTRKHHLNSTSILWFTLIPIYNKIIDNTQR